MIFRFEDYELDTNLFELRNKGEAVPVEPQVFDLLLLLIENRDQIVSKEELFDKVWEGRIVSDATLNSRMNAARKAIGDNVAVEQVDGASCVVGVGRRVRHHYDGRALGVQ